MPKVTVTNPAAEAERDATRVLSERLRDAEPLRRIPGRNRSKADIVVYRYDSVDIAVKDYSGRSLLIRNIVGRLMLRRETRAYREASEVPGLPRFLGRLGAFALATEWVEGRPLAELDPVHVDPVCFDTLERILDALHARGIALADLHHRDVLVGADARVWVIDLAMAYVLGPRPRWWRRRLFARLCEQDAIALARMRARASGEDLDAAIDRVGADAARWHRRGRRVRRFLDSLRGRRPR